MVGRERFELSTNGLKVHCSTAELTAPRFNQTTLSRKARRSLPLSLWERVRGEGSGRDDKHRSLETITARPNGENGFSLDTSISLGKHHG
jgi:hypothetical protein